ncbi:MAG: patatin-like phospholipase family protein [Spirochaetes bacterium]|nr:patatin-like phospholipase family protein [Spirochaetota bacterium]
MDWKKLLEVARKSALFKGLSERSLRKVFGAFHFHRLDKGDYLFRANQFGKTMYFIAAGKLRVERLTPENQLIRIASVIAGDIVGEVAMLTGERHTGQVRALTDAYVAGIGKHDLTPLLKHHPQLLENLTRIEATRLRNNVDRKHKNVIELGFVLHLYFATPADHSAAATHIDAALEAEKPDSLRILDRNFLDHLKGKKDAVRQLISRELMRFPSVYLALSPLDCEEAMIHALIQLADQIIVTLSEDTASVAQAAKILTAPKSHARVAMLNPYVVAVHHPSRDHLLLHQIEKQLRVGVKHRLRFEKNYWENDEHRAVRIQATMIARTIMNTSRGIAFGGGGARSLSEIGVVAVLERHRIEFDHVAGTSMGALIATFYAQGLTAREMSERFKEFLPSDRGLLRYSLPFISFFHDRSVNRILRRLFGNARIEDLPKPLTIIAADLISGREVRIKKGLIWRAIRASMSLPVVFPPVKYRGYYLVDGGAINNVPGNVLREQGVGRVLGINCTPLTDNSINEYLETTRLMQLLKPGDKFWRNLRRFFKLVRIFFTRPPILQIANRAMMLEGSELIKHKSREFDLLLNPDVAPFGLFEFDRREEIIDAGRHAAHRHDAELKKLFRDV